VTASFVGVVSQQQTLQLLSRQVSERRHYRCACVRVSARARVAAARISLFERPALQVCVRAFGECACSWRCCTIRDCRFESPLLQVCVRACACVHLGGAIIIVIIAIVLLLCVTVW